MFKKPCLQVLTFFFFNCNLSFQSWDFFDIWWFWLFGWFFKLFIFFLYFTQLFQSFLIIWLAIKLKLSFKCLNFFFICFWFVFNKLFELLKFFDEELIFLFVKCNLFFIINNFFHKLTLEFRLFCSVGLFDFFNFFCEFRNLIFEWWKFLIFLLWDVNDFVFLMS